MPAMEAGRSEWWGVIFFALMLYRWFSTSRAFGDPPAKPAIREEVVENLDDRIDPDGLAYRGRLVEDPPGSGRYRIEA